MTSFLFPSFKTTEHMLPVLIWKDKLLANDGMGPWRMLPLNWDAATVRYVVAHNRSGGGTFNTTEEETDTLQRLFTRQTTALYSSLIGGSNAP